MNTSSGLSFIPLTKVPVYSASKAGKGIHDAHPPVSDFIAAIFTQLQEGGLYICLFFRGLFICPDKCSGGE